MRPPSSTFGKILTGAAVFLAATTGTAYAVASVTSADIVDETIRSADIRDGSLQRADIAPSARLPRAFADANHNNPLNLTDTYVTFSSVQLPPGRWHVSAKNQVYGQFYIKCQLRRGATDLDASEGYNDTWTQFILPVETVVTLDRRQTIYSECKGNGNQIMDYDLYAVELAR